MRGTVCICLLLISACNLDPDAPGEAGESAQLPVESASTSSANRSHAPGDPHRGLSPAQHIKVALQHKREGRLSLAIDTLTQALGSYPAEKDILTVRASLFLETREFGKALGDLNAALSLEGADPRLLINRAEVYRQFGQVDEALSDLDRAISMNDNLVPAFFNRGVIHYQTGDFERALSDFTRCIDIDPHVAAPYFNRAAVRNAMGEQAGAISDIRRFTDLTDNENWKRKAGQLLIDWEASEADLRTGGEDGS